MDRRYNSMCPIPIEQRELGSAQAKEQKRVIVYRLL
jgi:hypothetical protein